MSQIFDLILPAYKASRAYVERLAKDIPNERFARLPVVNGKEILINHPAFNIGHLALYPERIANFLSIDSSQLAAPTQIKETSTFNHKCVDDPEGKIYLEPGKILEAFFTLYDKVIPLVQNVPNEVFFQPNTEERTKERFPLLGSFVFYLLSPHMQGHLGQVSAWRRCEGLPPA